MIVKSLRGKFVATISLLIIVILAVNASVLIRKRTKELREHLRHESHSFAQLSVEPICKNYSMYHEASFYKFVEMLKKYYKLNHDLVEIQIIDVNGRILTDKEELQKKEKYDWTRAEKKIKDPEVLKAVQQLTPSAIERRIDGKKVFDLIYPYVMEGGMHKLSVRYIFSYDLLNLQLANMKKSIILLTIIFIMVGAIIAMYLSSRITKPLGHLEKATTNIASGNLNEKITIDSEDEIGRLARTFNKMIHNLRDLAVRLKEAAAKISSFSGEILAASQQQSDGAAEQAAAVSQTTGTIEELLYTAGQIAENTGAVVTAAKETLESVESGRVAVADSVRGMEDIRTRTLESSHKIMTLGEKSQQIGGVVAIINEIAAETKMLSLNASIEAVRAGEAGKGFSVVASEIRKLAEKVVNSTSTIKAIVSEIQSAVNESVLTAEENIKGVEAQALLVERVGESLQKILHMAERTAQSAQQISVATQQQKVSSEQVVDSIREFSDVSRQSAASAKQVATSAVELDTLAQQLKEAVSRFKLNGTE